MSVILLIRALRSCSTISSSKVAHCIVMQEAVNRLEEFFSLH